MLCLSPVWVGGGWYQKAREHAVLFLDIARMLVGDETIGLQNCHDRRLKGRSRVPLVFRSKFETTFVNY